MSSHDSSCDREARRGFLSFLRGRHGSLLTWAAFLMVPLLSFVGIGSDAARGYLVRARLSQALDAAALAAGRAGTDYTKAQTMAQTLFKANFPDGYMGAVLAGPNISFDTVAQKVNVSASAALQTYFVHLIGIDTFTVSANSEVTASGINLEVSLVIDVTGSMAGQKITDLKAASKNLIDIVIWADQSQYTSKIAMVPWSAGVNALGTAAQLRGGVAATKAITGATRTNPVVVTSANHGFNNGDKVFISGVNGMTQIRNNVANSPTATTQPQFWVVYNKTANTFALRRVNNSNANGTSWGTYSSGGAISCTTPGCQYQTFTSDAGNWRTFTINTCVTERTGAEAYTDAAPSAAPLGRHYTLNAAVSCPATTLIPLSNDKTALKNAIDAVTATGTTAGQIGTAWAWYTISPNFAYLWPAASQPAAYGAQELAKITIIMTDGEYNTAYCNDVLSADSTGNSNDQINCNPNNGDPYTQARGVCDAMKLKGIIVYTVGFQLGGQQSAIDVLQYCASDLAHFFQADDGAALYDAFRRIAVNIRKLRISK